MFFFLGGGGSPIVLISSLPTFCFQFGRTKNLMNKTLLCSWFGWGAEILSVLLKSFKIYWPTVEFPRWTHFPHDCIMTPSHTPVHPHSLREASSVGSNCHMCWKLSHNSRLVFGGSRRGCNEMSYTPSQLAKSSFCLQPLCGTVRKHYELPTTLIGSFSNRKKWSVTVIERLLCLGKLLIRKTIASSSLYAVSLIVPSLAGLISLARIWTCEAVSCIEMRLMLSSGISVWLKTQMEVVTNLFWKPKGIIFFSFTVMASTLLACLLSRSDPKWHTMSGDHPVHMKITTEVPHHYVWHKWKDNWS